MKTLAELRTEAEAASEGRGHELKWQAPWIGIGWAGGDIQDGYCTTCPAEVQLLTKTAPNQIDIGGTAVALTCPLTEAVPDGDGG